MYRMHQHGKTPSDVAHGTIGNTRALIYFIFMMISPFGLAAVLGWSVMQVLGLSIMQTAGSAQPSRPPIAAAPRAALDPSRFILNALLVPALDGDAVPLRWVDPRPALRCGPDTTMRVNREPLLAGAFVQTGIYHAAEHSGPGELDVAVAHLDGAIPAARELALSRSDQSFVSKALIGCCRRSLWNAELERFYSRKTVGKFYTLSFVGHGKMRHRR